MISTHQLSNGARVFIEEIPYVKSAAIGVFIKVGSRHEVPEINGISHFLEHMIFKGTKNRSARDIAESFEEMGGQLNAYTSKEHTCLYARVLDEKIFDAMDLLFEMLFCSSLEEKELAVERGVILEEINMYEDSPDDLIHDVFTQTILDGHSLGRPILGKAENIISLSTEQIREYYRSYYCPSNMVISVAGNVQAADIVRRIETYDGYGRNDVPKTGNTVPEVKQGIKLVAKDTEQVQICLGVPGISYLDERRHTQNIMNSILGGGMSSRLFQKIREEKGLAYSVYSYPSTYRDVGAYVIYIGTGPANVKEFFAILKDELDRFVEEGVTIEEVSRTQNQIKASVYLGLESIMTRMNRLGKSILLFDRIISVEEVIEKVFAVTPEMVQAYAAQTIGSGRFSLASIGEASILPQVEEEFRKMF